MSKSPRLEAGGSFPSYSNHPSPARVFIWTRSLNGRCEGPASAPVLGRPDRRCGRSSLTTRQLSYKMSCMRKATVSVRELQQNLKRVMARVERGQVIEVTRRRRPIARLAPLRSAGPLSPWPDLDERTHAVFGDRIVKPGPSAMVIEGRGDR